MRGEWTLNWRTLGKQGLEGVVRPRECRLPSSDEAVMRLTANRIGGGLQRDDQFWHI